MLYFGGRNVFTPTISDVQCDCSLIRKLLWRVVLCKQSRVSCYGKISNETFQTADKSSPPSSNNTRALSSCHASSKSTNRCFGGLEMKPRTLKTSIQSRVSNLAVLALAGWVLGSALGLLSKLGLSLKDQFGRLFCDCVTDLHGRHYINITQTLPSTHFFRDPVHVWWQCSQFSDTLDFHLLQILQDSNKGRSLDSYLQHWTNSAAFPHFSSKSQWLWSPVIACDVLYCFSQPVQVQKLSESPTLLGQIFRFQDSKVIEDFLSVLALFFFQWCMPSCCYRCD